MKNLNAYIKITLTLLLLSIPAFAQDVEYGDPSELKGVTKIFVHTEAGMEVRQNIIKHIQEKLPNVTVTSRPEEAEVTLLFAANFQTYFAGVYRSSNAQGTGTVNVDPYGNYGTYSGQASSQTTTTPMYRNVIEASGLVFKVTSENRVRMLMDFKDTRTSILERRPSTNFAKAFVKAYEQANGKQKK